MAQRVGFVSTRFAGTDGVSLESAKWAQILWDHRHRSFWYGGRLDRASDVSVCVPEAHYEHPEIVWLNQQIWGVTRRSPLVTRRIHALADYLKGTIYEFVERFGIDILIIENALSMPMHVPLGVALAQFLAETEVPAIAHHHDFYWERSLFSVNAVRDYLDMAFPPRDPELQHVVINHAAQEELSWRKGLPSILVPNVLDFENPPPPRDEHSTDIRSELGLTPDDVLILQPTGVIPQKGIEHAIELVEQLRDERYKLVVSHAEAEHGQEYESMLLEMAQQARVDIRFIATRIGDGQLGSQGQDIYTLWDLYHQADLVTYPSLYEGFGNAFLEAVYFKLPVVVNRYATFASDIEPKGFRVLTMDGYVTPQLVQDVKELLNDPGRRREMVEQNFELGRQFFSYSVLRRKLRSIFANILGQAEQ